MKLIPVNSGNSRQKAFTMIELMVALIVFSIITVVLFKIFPGGSRTASRGNWTNNSITLYYDLHQNPATLKEQLT